MTHTLSYSYSTGGSAAVTAVSATAEEETNLDLTVPASSTNMLTAYVLDVSQCKGFFMVADADMTVKTNSSGSPAQTFTLTAGTPIAWIYGSGTCPVTSDVTALYITSAAGGLLTIRSLIDPTV